jgi:hypothetical protein
MSGTIGSGSAGTCFSGGAGSGGTYFVTVPETSGTGDAGTNGGFGSDGAVYGESGANLGGAGNPAGAGGGEGAVGTGGVLIIFVEGTITKEVEEGGDPFTAKYFTANGANGGPVSEYSSYDTYCRPFGGGSGGGIVILVNNNSGDLAANVQAIGGFVASDGPGGAANFRSAGDGAAAVYTFSEL